MDVNVEEFDTKRNCRVCLEIHPEMVLLFGSKERSYNYGEMLGRCCKVTVEENDGLPAVLCPTCLHNMTQACQFVDKCQDSDAKLRSYLERKKDSGLEETKMEVKDLKNIKDEPDFLLSDYPLDDFPVDEDLKEELDDLYSDVKLSEIAKKWKAKKSNLKSNNILKNKRKKLTPMNCDQCGLMVRSKSAMIIHIATHSEERPFKCKDCGKSYRSRGNLRKHIITVHAGEDNRKFKCGECAKSFYCRSELVVHSRTHTGDTPYQCEMCPKAFTQISALSRHRLTHTGEKPFQCAVCGKKFSTRDNLKNHMVVHTSEKKFTCKICGFLLKTRGSLVKHQLLHTNVKAFVCDQCGRSFRTKGNLKLHMDKKHSEKSGYCMICSKRYSDMDEHNNIHTGNTPFQCSMCNKKYGVKRSLLVHMRKHDNQEKYSCDYDGCVKKFPIKCMLEFHVLKYHKKQTPHICNFCNRGFFRLNDLNLHKKMNHLCLDLPKNVTEKS